MNQQLFKRLLEQYIAGELSSEGKARLQELIHLPEYEQTLEAFVQEIMLSDDYSNVDSPEIKSGILTYLDQHINVEAGNAAPRETEKAAREKAHPIIPIRRRFPAIGRYAAAAIVLILLSGAGYLVWKKNHQTLNPPIAIQHDAPPGRNGAILTLAGGKQIVLDSAGSGELAEQGRMAIVKSNGQISYQPETANKGDNEVLYNTISTPRGRQFELVLSDGTHVYLNAASSITFPTVFTGNKRSVAITGEAYFDVVHHPSMPFVITVRGTQVEVLGTRLNINAYDDEDNIKTTLLQGKVRVSEHSGAVLLQPGEQAQTGSLPLPRIIKDAPVDEVMAWKNGFFQFDGASVQTVMRQLSRWYDVDVSYQGATPDHRFVGKVGRDYNLSEVLAVLSASDVHFSIEGKKLIVKP